MFSSIFIYPVPRSRMDEFLRIHGEALKIYREFGAIDDVTYRPIDVGAKYGCVGFDSTIELRGDEIVCVSVSFFRNRAHHDEVMKKIDNDPRIDALYERIQKVIDIRRIARGEFERAV